MFRIGKTFEFSAAHHLPNLAVGHKCRNPHGHNYTVQVVLEAATVDIDGFVLDYGELDEAKALIARLDHTDLNDLPYFKAPDNPPTAENLALGFWKSIAKLYPGFVVEITVSETPKTFATYRPT